MKRMLDKWNSLLCRLVRPSVSPGESGLPVEIHARLRSIAEWREFYAAHRFINDPQYVNGIGDAVRRAGFFCPFHQRHAPPTEIVMGEPNYREGLLHGNLNSRMRAVWLELSRFLAGCPAAEVRIYAPEAITAFALLLRGRFPRFIGSEYAPDENARQSLFPVRHESLLDLTFPGGVFDAVVINDVFEHVPDVDRGLAEAARVLRPGGRLVSTFPFNIGGSGSVVKARLTENGVEHLMPPEYHGNPVDPKGSLVFEIPGWDILERAKRQGFSMAEIVYETSLRHGVLGGGFSGIFTMVAER
ncbi:MAG: class I SAM-dependent methyltransferase [Desulfovibrio aminophilus]|uniref:class I SAM-dependent methyltransferase n=1 Tax=Desulfovibrio aminophilus TaxID=81425 RepID=UPI0039E8F8E9